MQTFRLLTGFIQQDFSLLSEFFQWFLQTYLVLLESRIKVQAGIKVSLGQFYISTYLGENHVQVEFQIIYFM